MALKFPQPKLCNAKMCCDTWFGVEEHCWSNFIMHSKVVGFILRDLKFITHGFFIRMSVSCIKRVVVFVTRDKTFLEL